MVKRIGMRRLAAFAAAAALVLCLVGCGELFSLTPLLTCDRTGFLLAAGCAGWGGLSVLCQTAALLDGTEYYLSDKRK